MHGFTAPCNFSVSVGRISKQQQAGFEASGRPGSVTIVGVEPLAANGYPPLHNDRFDFTDDTIAVGRQMFVELVENFAV